MAEWQTRLVQVQVLSPEWGFNSPRRHQIFCRKLRVWHNGCAPAFQAGYRGSTPLTRSIKFGGIPERPKGADCKSASTAFDGSNPSPTTISKITHLKRGAFFFAMGEEISDVRERSEGNPSPTTISKIAGAVAKP